VAAPVYGTSGTWASTGTTTLNLAVPASVASGDIIVAAFFIDGSTVTITGPAGFAHAPNSPRTVNAGAAGNHSVNVLWKRASAADSGTYAFTLSAGGYAEGQAHRFTTCIASGNPWDGNTASTGDGGATNSTTTPAVSFTTTGPDELFFFAGTNWSGGAWTPPTGFTEITDNAADLTADYKVQASAGSSGTVQATCAGNDKVGAWLGALIGTTTASASSTPQPIVVSAPAPRPQGNSGLFLRNTLADPPVLTTPEPLIVTTQPPRAVGNAGIVLRNTLADPPVLTTKPPLVIETAGRPAPVNPTYVSRSSVVDVVVAPTATPEPLVVSPTVVPPPGGAILRRNTLVDPPVLTTPAPLVVTISGQPAPVDPALFGRSSLMDLATPPPLVVTSPWSPAKGGTAPYWRSSLIDLATPEPLVVTGPWAPARVGPAALFRSSLADAVVVTGVATPPPIVVTTVVRWPWTYRPIVVAGSSQVCDCTTHRPNTGITARPGTGVTARPNTGTTAQPCTC
jgi:hypothetical protein